MHDNPAPAVSAWRKTPKHIKRKHSWKYIHVNQYKLEQGYTRKRIINITQTSCYLFSKRRFKEARERNENTAKDKSERHDETLRIIPTQSPDPQKSRVHGKGSDPRRASQKTRKLLGPGNRPAKLPKRLSFRVFLKAPEKF